MDFVCEDLIKIVAVFDFYVLVRVSCMPLSTPSTTLFSSFLSRYISVRVSTWHSNLSTIRSNLHSYTLISISPPLYRPANILSPPHSCLRRSPHPAATTVHTHIKLLHAYNETRDLATGLMGILADNRGVRACDVHAQFGVEDEAS